jgi:hypothetical protein
MLTRAFDELCRDDEVSDEVLDEVTASFVAVPGAFRQIATR